MSNLRRRPSGSAHRSSARRKLVWATIFAPSVVASATTNNIDLGAALEVAGSSLLGVTIMRTHVRLQVQNFAAIAADLQVGLIVGRAADIGVANVDGINAAAQELDWAYLDMITPNSSAAVVDASQNFMIDNRSKRKMDELGQRYLLSITNNAAASLTVQVFARTLFALP
jgi:hypothetical protein